MPQSQYDAHIASLYQSALQRGETPEAAQAWAVSQMGAMQQAQAQAHAEAVAAQQQMSERLAASQSAFVFGPPSMSSSGGGGP